MKYNILMTESAEKDIAQAVLYISEELKNPSAANDLLNIIKDRLTTISEFPFAFGLCGDIVLNSAGIRFIEVNNYLLFYRVKEDQKNLIIERFLYNKRDWETIFKNM